MTNKIRKYKKGDKVVIFDNIKDLGESNKFYNNKIYKITELRPIKNDSNPDHKQIINSLDNMGCCLVNTRFEYYYEKPLNELFKFEEMDTISATDYRMIKNFIEREETLTDDELKQCAKIWEKYNKNEK